MSADMEDAPRLAVVFGSTQARDERPNIRDGITYVESTTIDERGLCISDATNTTYLHESIHMTPEGQWWKYEWSDRAPQQDAGWWSRITSEEADVWRSRQ